MRTATLHNLPTTQAHACAVLMQGCSAYQILGGSLVSIRPSNPAWCNEIFVEGAAFARGSKDPIQEALL